MSTNKRVRYGLTFLALAALASGAVAQEDGGEPAAAPVKPRPAEIMPRADRSLLLDVTRVGTRYIAVGDRGHILASKDGKNWTQVPVPVRAALTAVYFVDEQNGWAVGHDAVILATRDGGRTWALQNFEPELEKPFLDVYFLDPQRGFAVGAYGFFYATGDGGQSWSEVEAPALRDDEYHLNSIVRLRNGDLFIAGEFGMLGLSKDDGQTWTRLTPPYDSSLFGALPYGDAGVLIFGLRGNAFYASDVAAVPELTEDYDPLTTSEDDLSGKGWTVLNTNTVASLFGGTALKGGDMALVGLNGKVLRVSGDASQVQQLGTSTGKALSAAVPLDGRLIVVGESGIEQVELR